MHLNLSNVFLTDFVTGAYLAVIEFERLLAISHLVTVFLKHLFLTVFLKLESAYSTTFKLCFVLGNIASFLTQKVETVGPVTLPYMDDGAEKEYGDAESYRAYTRFIEAKAENQKR